MKHFGTGPTLAESSPWLSDPAERHRRILDVTERNSVMEGLPRFTAELREDILRQLRAMRDARNADDLLGPLPGQC